MELENLKTFITLANLGNFTQTAQQHMVVQSTVSNRIQELEREIGTPLFVRERKNVRLTPAGEIFLTYATQIITLEDYALSGINMLGAYSDSLRIGSVHTLYDCHLADCLIPYIKNHPNISVKVLLEHSRNLLNLLYDNIIDLCFTYRRFLHPDYECLPFRQEQILLVTGKSNSHYQKGIRNEELKTLPLFYSDFIEATESSWFHQIFAKHSVYPLEIDVGNKLISFLENGLGFGFLPESAVARKLNEGVLLEVPVPELQVPKLNSYMIMKKQTRDKLSVHYWMDDVF